MLNPSVDACNLLRNSVNATESCFKQGAVAACHLLDTFFSSWYLDCCCLCWSIFLSSVRIGYWISKLLKFSSYVDRYLQYYMDSYCSLNLLLNRNHSSTADMMKENSSPPPPAYAIIIIFFIPSKNNNNNLFFLLNNNSYVVCMLHYLCFVPGEDARRNILQSVLCRPTYLEELIRAIEKCFFARP